MAIATLFRHPSASRTATKLDGKALDQLFRKARTHNGWRAIERLTRSSTKTLYSTTPRAAFTVAVMRSTASRA